LPAKRSTRPSGASETNHFHDRYAVDREQARSYTLRAELRSRLLRDSAAPKTGWALLQKVVALPSRA
jgi:hypothetical protein